MTPDYQLSASGKLFLFGEYLVLRGAKALAMPLCFGQKMTVSGGSEEELRWECFQEGKMWLKAVFSEDFDIKETDNPRAAAMIRNILLVIRREAPERSLSGHYFRFDIDFDRKYGFGTSSTLVSLVGRWAGIDPYLLLKQTFGGSGYDVAAATAPGLFTYELSFREDVVPQVSPARISPQITSHLLFVYLGKKQDTRESVARFAKYVTTGNDIKAMNRIIENVLLCSDIDHFERLMEESEHLLSGILDITPVGDQLFADYRHAIKSLGAWGGDFVMASFRDEDRARTYFRQKGLSPVFNYRELIKK